MYFGMCVMQEWLNCCCAVSAQSAPTTVQQARGKGESKVLALCQKTVAAHLGRLPYV